MISAVAVTLAAGALTVGIAGIASAEPAIECGPGIEGQIVSTPDHRDWQCFYGSDGPLGEPGRYWHWSEVKSI